MFPKELLLKNALFVNVGGAKSFFKGQICFLGSNLFCGIYGVRPSASKIYIFRKLLLSNKALFVNVGVAKSIFTGQIYF